MSIQQFDYNVNLLQVLSWQDNTAINLPALLELKQAWYTLNQTNFWSNWYNDVFNLQTANDFGLAVWAIILGLPLQIDENPDPMGKPIFGFGSETMTPNGKVNFNRGNFTNVDSGFVLTTEEKRLALKLRYFQLTSNTTIPACNRFFAFAFSAYAPGKVYLLDGLKMYIRAVFTFDPGYRLLYILKQYDLIPRGAGVRIEYVVNPHDIFGFGSETMTPNGKVNFDRGIFPPEDTE